MATGPDGPYREGTMTTPMPQHAPPPSPWPMQRNHGGATAALICGIIGLVAVPGLGVVGWILGHMALKEIDASPQWGWANRDHATIGKILGIVGTVLYGAIFLLVILMYVGMFVLVIALEGSA